MKKQFIACIALAAVSGSTQALSPAVLDADRARQSLKEVVIHGDTGLVLGAYMASICNTDFDTFFFASNAGLPTDHRAYSCTLKNAIAGTGGWAAGTPLLVIARDLGGSAYGVVPIVKQWPENTMVVDNAANNCVPTGLPAKASQASYTCRNLALRQAIAGISAAEPSAFAKVMTVGSATGVPMNLPAGSDDNGNSWTPVLASSELYALNTASVNQMIYAAAVSVPLRNAMQAAAGLVAGSEDPADMPSMSHAFYAAVAAGFAEAGVAGRPGWDALTGRASDNSFQVNLCRGAGGTGIEAASNFFFLEETSRTATRLDTPYTPTQSGFLFPVGANGIPLSAHASSLAVIESGSPVGVTLCLGNASALGAYAMGVLSYDQDPGTSGWRYVKIDGSMPSQARARVGAWPFLYTGSLQWKKAAPGNPDAPTVAFLTDMRKNLGTPAGIVTLTNASAARAALAPPSSYTGTCASQTAGSANALYGSCVEHLDFASLYNDGVLFYGLAGLAVYGSSSSQPLHIVK